MVLFDNSAVTNRFTLAILLSVAAACGGADSGPTVGPPTASMGTFERIQAQVLAQSCTAGCHTANSGFAASSGLVLDPAVAYRNLVGAAPKNTAAHADRLLRVKPFRADSSLLYHKLVIAEGHHSANYGSIMPLGKEPIYNGELEFIRRWIEAGAPEKGSVVDTAVLADRTRPVPVPFTPLAVPPQGLQLRIEPFSVAPNFERELFVYRRLGNAADLYVNRIETRMRTNSHHLVLYTFEPTIPAFLVPTYDQIRDIRNADGSLNLLNVLPMGFHVFFAGTQTPSSDYRFPAGVALRVAANGSLDLNSHYVNRSTAPLTGEAYVNLHTAAANEVRHVARTLNMGNADIVLPPRTRTTLVKSFTVRDSTMHVFMLTSHMHERGERFAIKVLGGARDGEVVYTTTDWAHPDITTFAQPIVLRPGEGLTSEITYNNTTDRTIRFGLTSQDEMGIIFGYFYY